MSLEPNRVLSGPPKATGESATGCRRVAAQSGNRGTVVGKLVAQGLNGRQPMRPDCLIETAGAGRRSLVRLPSFRLCLPGSGMLDPVAMPDDGLASRQRAGVRGRRPRPVPAGCPASVVRGQPSLAQCGPVVAGRLWRVQATPGDRGRLATSITPCLREIGA